MAHMQKFKGSSATHIIGHCEREKGKEGYLKYRNGSYIDESRSHLNRSYPTHVDGRRRLRERLDQVAPKRRKDAVTMIDWVVTLPESLSEADEKAQIDFFRVSAAFLNKRYGEQNLVGAYLHFDETTPHLHYCFVPVVNDPDGTERLCAKQLMSKKELNRFHKELDKTLEDYFDMPGLALTGITKSQGGNKSVSELKKVSKQVNVLKNVKNRLERQIETLRGQLLSEVDQDAVIELFKALPATKQFQAIVEAELPETQLQPDLMDDLIEDYYLNPCESVLNDGLFRELQRMADQHVANELDQQRGDAWEWDDFL